MSLHYYLRIENAEDYVLIGIYLFVCVLFASQIFLNPNRMKFGGMIGYYLGTICFDFGIDRVKGQGHEKVNIFLNRMKFGGMIGYYCRVHPHVDQWISVTFPGL